MENEILRNINDFNGKNPSTPTMANQRIFLHTGRKFGMRGYLCYRLDDVRDTLRRGDIKTAASLACVFTLTPIAV